MKAKPRRAPTIRERITSCICCGHFLSHRHHLLPYAKFGENISTVPLCANCHEIYHLLEKIYLLQYNYQKDYREAGGLPPTNFKHVKSWRVYSGIAEELCKEDKYRFLFYLVQQVSILARYLSPNSTIQEKDMEIYNDYLSDFHIIIEDWVQRKEVTFPSEDPMPLPRRRKE